MKRSEIFDSFVKIAQEKGLVSNDSSEAKKKLEQTGRAGSDDVSTIEALYGVKPDASKGMDYKSNIMEVAHPNSVVVSPSYDKLNGLVESNIERQNILLNIVNKPVNGHATQHKYAEKELILSLVRIGNDLDNTGREDLRALADSCLMQISPIKKQAYAAAVVGVVAALIGGVWLKNHLPFINEGFEKNHEKLMSEIEDILTAGTPTLGVGYKYKESFIAELQKFKSDAEKFYQIMQRVMPVIEKLDLINPQDVLRLAQSANGNAVKQAYDTLSAAYNAFLPSIRTILKNFANEDYKLRQIEEKGFFSKLVDAPQIFHGGKGLVADDFDDIRHALETYRNSIAEIAKTLREAKSYEKAATQQVEQAMNQSKADMPELSIDSTGPAPTPATSPTRSPVQEADEQAGNLMGGLAGLMPPR